MKIPDAPFPDDEDEVPKLGLPIEGTNYLELCGSIEDAWHDIDKGSLPENFQLTVDFGDFHFDGNITDFVLQEMKDYGMEDAFPDDLHAYWVLDTGLVSGVIIPGVGMSFTIDTGRTETVEGEAEFRGSAAGT